MEHFESPNDHEVGPTEWQLGGDLRAWALVMEGISGTIARDNEGRTPLHYVARSARLPCGSGTDFCRCIP